MSTGILNYTTNLREYLWEKGMEEHPALTELRLETAKLPQSMMQICPKVFAKKDLETNVQETYLR